MSQQSMAHLSQSDSDIPAKMEMEKTGTPVNLKQSLRTKRPRSETSPLSEADLHEPNRGEVLGIVSQLSDFKDEIRKMMSTFTDSQDKEFRQVVSTLKEIQQSNNNIESSIAYLTAQNEEFKKKINELENQNKEDKKYIAVLESKIEDLQMDSRKGSFEIKNVPKKDQESREDLIKMVMCLTENIDCQMTQSDIKDIYRVRGKKADQTNTPIIVETNSTLLKTDVMRMGKSFNIKHKNKLCAKHLGFKSNEDTPIYLSEHLTLKGSRLHFLARDLAKSKKYKFCWTAYGKVYVRASDTSPVINIKSEEQVHKLLLEPQRTLLEQ